MQVLPTFDMTFIIHHGSTNSCTTVYNYLKSFTSTFSGFIVKSRQVPTALYIFNTVYYGTKRFGTYCRQGDTIYIFVDCFFQRFGGRSKYLPSGYLRVVGFLRVSIHKYALYLSALGINVIDVK